MTLNTLHIASLIAIFQSVFMAFFFLQNKKSSKASNVLIATMLAVFAVLVGCSLLISLRIAGSRREYRDIILLLSQSALLIGPLFFLYIKANLDVHFVLRKEYFLHALPFLTAVGAGIVIVEHYGQFSIWQYPGRPWITAAVVIQNFAYLVLTWKSMRLQGLTVGSFLSYIDNSRLAWVRFFTGGYILLWLIQLQLFVGWDILGHPQWCPYGLSLYFVVTFLFFNGIVYIALKRPETFSQAQKYRSSSLKESDKNRFREKLVALMKSEKVYLNSSITLPELSLRLNIAPCSLSQVINESFRQNFSDFINAYRIEESKLILARPEQQWNISEIALEVGFNSKSTFNSAFRKHTGVTPKEFKKQVVSSS